MLRRPKRSKNEVVAPKEEEEEAHIVRSLMMVITLKHAGAVLMSILILLSKQFSCASVGNKTLIDHESLL